MKKLVEHMASFCDVCGAEGYINKCLSCGQEYCFKCSECQGKTYSHGVTFGGTGDGFYCNQCDRRLTLSGEDPLHNAYAEIKSLRRESQDYYNDFSKKSKEAEERLKELLKEKSNGL